MISPFQTVLITRLSTNNRNKKGFTHIFAVTPEKAIITTLLYKSYKTFLCVRFRSPNWIYCNWLSFGIRWQLGCLCLLIVKNGIVYERVSKRLFHVCFDVYFFSLDTFLFIMFLFFLLYVCSYCRMEMALFYTTNWLWIEVLAERNNWFIRH